MKMKKYVLSVLVSGVVFLLAACGADPRKEFVNEMFDSKAEAASAASFDMKIKDLTYEGDEGGAYVNMIASQLKDMSIKGNYAYDEKKDVMQMNITTELFGEKIPLEFVSQKDKYYLSTSFVNGALNLAKSFDYPLDLSKEDLAKIKGKFIDLGEAEETITSDKSDDKDNPLKNSGIKLAQTSEMEKEIKKLILGFDKKSFKKEENVVSHTFTKKEIIKILEKMDEVAKADKEYKKEYEKDGLDKDVKDMIKSLKKDVDKADVKVSLNQKSKARDMELSFSNTDENDNKVGMVLAMNMKPEKNDKKINVPSKKELISEDELNNIFSKIMGSYVDNAGLGEGDEGLDGTFDSDDPDTQAIIDEQLNEIIKEINENPEMITAETAEEIRTSAKVIFNDEQMKKLNEALDNVLQGKSI
ncbi:hypothetical protein GIX45_02715 [Erwinia sp. CPCC 100877]|nr:hypothetical protein [Erwinia sp. CPCC 100877]